MARDLHNGARDGAGVVPRAHAVARARGLVLREDGEPSDVSGDGGAAAEHAEGALALFGAAQLDVRVERGDDLVVERRGLERVKGRGLRLDWMVAGGGAEAQETRSHDRGRTTRLSCRMSELEGK